MNKDQVRTRFAPSPTGYMHIGNLRTALYAYLFAKAKGGRFILRIEDTDQARYVADAVDFIKRTLDQAGIVPDEGPDIGGEFGPYVQSERREIYQKYAEELIAKGYAYRCFCETKGDSVDGADSKSKNGFSGYDRTCRDLSSEKIAEFMEKGSPYVIRQKMPLTGETTYHDLLHGNITIANAELEDQVLIKRDGMPTYNFANVVDDHLMGVTHIIRGEEFITSTPKHVLLYQSFGWELPEFIHLAPVMGQNPDGSTSKLSKRHGATSFDDLVRAGYLPEAIVNYVALLGWNPKNTNQEIFSLQELIDHFSLEGLSKSPAVFDAQKLGWVSGEYFKKMADEDFAVKAREYAGELPSYLENKWDYLARLLKTRISRFGEIPEQIAFLSEMPTFDVALYNNKRNKVTTATALAVLPRVSEILTAADESEWNNDRLYMILNDYIATTEYKKGQALWPIRIAVAGLAATPGGATDILYLLGKAESLRRLNISLQKLREL